MIKITAESKGNKTKLRINISGTGEDIVTEAVHIMQQLPKQIEQTSQPLFFRFLADLTETGMFGVGVKPEDPEEDKDDENKNPIAGRTFYCVYRIMEINDIDHSGNRETRGGWYETREEAERLAETLNEEGK